MILLFDNEKQKFVILIGFNQRYKSLDEMVGKIVEDETQKSLLASSNALNISFKQLNNQHQLLLQQEFNTK